VVITKEIVSFAFIGDDQQIDHIPLSEIDFVVDMKDHEIQAGLEATAVQGADDQYKLQIATKKDGYNSGRVYRFATSDRKEFEAIIAELKKLAEAARKRAEAHNLFRKIQFAVREQYEASHVQALMALMIMANFGATITEVQFVDSLANPDGSPTQLQVTLDRLNLFFTLLFTAELAVNAFSHWFFAFVRNPWSILDAFIVGMSVLSLIVTNQPTGIVRILRALRVIRLFGRINSLKKIISALTKSLLPVLHVFLIMFLIMGIFSVVAVSFFAASAPENFEVPSAYIYRLR